MRIILAVVGFIAFACLSVEATARQLQMPSPCDHVIPTGAPLPRQAVNDTVGGGAILYDVPVPGRSSQKVGLIGADEAFTILRECNTMLQVRNARGEEGWTKVMVSRAERELLEAARKRPPATDRDCEIYNLDRTVADRCKASLALTRQREANARSAVFLRDDQLSSFLAGKTITLSRVDQRAPTESDKIRLYYAPDGELFVYRDAPLIRWRGRWVVDGDTLCAPYSGTACARIRDDGARKVWVIEDFPDQTIVVSDGDDAHIVAEVAKRYPDAVPPPAPDGADAVSGPAMGR